MNLDVGSYGPGELDIYFPLPLEHIQQWSEPIVSGQGDGPITKIVLPSGTVAPHLSILQTGPVGHWHWSIHQLSVSGKPVPLAKGGLRSRRPE
jgi:hypothetical protein